MLQQLQKPVSNLSAAIQTALSETRPSKRNRSQKFLDFNLNEKPLSNSFATIWFSRGKTSSKNSVSLSTPEPGQIRLVSACESVMQFGDLHTFWWLKPASKWQSWESWSIISNGKLVWNLDTEHSPTWKSPSAMAGHQARISLTSCLSHDYPGLFSAQT